MYLNDLLIVHHYNAVADGLQKQPQLQGILLDLRITAHNKFGTIGEGDLAVELGGHIAEKFRRFLGLFLRSKAGFDHHTVPEHAEHALKDQAQPLPAGVHYPGFFQNRQQVGGVFQSFSRAGAGGFPNFYGIGPFLLGFQSLSALLGGYPGHGKNGALRGFHHSLISGVHAQLQRMDQLLRADLLFSLQTLGDPPEQQGKNDAGVSSRSPQHGGSGFFGGFPGGSGIGKGFQFLGSGADGHGHIGAGIAVRHRENVQLIYLLFVFCDVI